MIVVLGSYLFLATKVPTNFRLEGLEPDESG